MCSRSAEVDDAPMRQACRGCEAAIAVGGIVGTVRLCPKVSFCLNLGHGARVIFCLFLSLYQRNAFFAHHCQIQFSSVSRGYPFCRLRLHKFVCEAYKSLVITSTRDTFLCQTTVFILYLMINS